MAWPPSGLLPSKRQIDSFTISTEADGLSAALVLGGATLASIVMSTTWTAASMTFQASYDGGTSFFDVYSSTGGEITYTTTASRIMTFDPAFWLGIEQLKVRSGTSATPVAQAAERTLYLVTQALGVIK